MEVVVRESMRLPNARTQGRRASWTNDAEGKKIPEVAINFGLLAEAFLQLLASGLGVIALVWATVVLLSGFSTVLLKIDFWFVTAIVLIETARIVGYNSGPEVRFFVDVFTKISQSKFARGTGITDAVLAIPGAPIFAAAALISLSILRIVVIFGGSSYGHYDTSDCKRIVVVFGGHIYGHYDTSTSDYKPSKGNIKPALLLFYILVLVQGGLFILWFLVAVLRSSLTEEMGEQYFGVKEVGRKWIDRYVVATADTCIQKGVVSTINTTLVSFAAELLQAEVTDEHLLAVVLLHAVTTRKERTAGAVQQICASEQALGRLFRILRSEEKPYNEDIKALTADIIAKLSSNLCLADLPGAANGISSLLDAHSMKTAADPDSNNNLQSPGENHGIRARVPDLPPKITPDENQGIGAGDLSSKIAPGASQGISAGGPDLASEIMPRANEVTPSMNQGITVGFPNLRPEVTPCENQGIRAGVLALPLEITKSEGQCINAGFPELPLKITQSEDQCISAGVPDLSSEIKPSTNQGISAVVPDLSSEIKPGTNQGISAGLPDLSLEVTPSENRAISAGVLDLPPEVTLFETQRINVGVLDLSLETMPGANQGIGAGIPVLISEVTPRVNQGVSAGVPNLPREVMPNENHGISAGVLDSTPEATHIENKLISAGVTDLPPEITPGEDQHISARVPDTPPEITQVSNMPPEITQGEDQCIMAGAPYLSSKIMQGANQGISAGVPDLSLEVMYGVNRGISAGVPVPLEVTPGANQDISVGVIDLPLDVTPCEDELINAGGPNLTPEIMPDEDQCIGAGVPNSSSEIMQIISAIIAGVPTSSLEIKPLGKNQSIKSKSAAGVNNNQQSIVVNIEDEQANDNYLLRALRKPLIVHGLLILVKLAKNPGNAKEIFSTDGLFSMITAPISKELYKLFRDDNTAIEITEKSLQVVSKLVSGTDETNKKIRQEIRSSGLALNTIRPILTEDRRYDMLKVPAIKILTKLILTESSRNNSAIVDFINELMGLFVDCKNDNILRKTAGKALASLAMDSKLYCEKVFKYNDKVVDQFSNMLSDSRNKTAIANLLMQFCALRSEEARRHLASAKTKILEKLLKTICNVEPETSSNQPDLPEKWPCLAAFKVSVPCFGTLSTEDRRDRSGRRNSVPIEPSRRKTLVAFLGLAVQMCECDKLLDATDFDAAVKQIFSSKAELQMQNSHPSNLDLVVVDKIKEVIELCNKESVALLKGRGPAADYLVIIKSVTKLCAWVVRTNPNYVRYFQENNIAQKLEDALKAMRGLEMALLLSCREPVKDDEIYVKGKPLLQDPKLQNEMRKVKYDDAISNRHDGDCETYEKGKPPLPTTGLPKLTLEEMQEMQDPYLNLHYEKKEMQEMQDWCNEARKKGVSTINVMVPQEVFNTQLTLSLSFDDLDNMFILDKVDVAFMTLWCLMNNENNTKGNIGYLDPTRICKLAFNRQINPKSDEYKNNSPEEIQKITKEMNRKARSDVVDYIGKCMREWRDKDCIIAPYNFNDHWICLILVPTKGYALVLDSLDMNKESYADIVDAINCAYRSYISEGATQDKTRSNEMDFAHKSACYKQPRGSVHCGYYTCNFIACCWDYMDEITKEPRENVAPTKKIHLTEEDLYQIVADMCRFILNQVIKPKGEYFVDPKALSA